MPCPHRTSPAPGVHAAPVERLAPPWLTARAAAVAHAWVRRPASPTAGGALVL